MNPPRLLCRWEDGNDRARKLFKDALAIDNQCMDAVFALFDLELEEGNFETAIKLLEPHLVHSRGDFVHRRLADAHLMNSNVESALKHYELALRVNPEYTPAKEGIEQATKALSATDDGDGVEQADDDGQSGYE